MCRSLILGLLFAAILPAQTVRPRPAPPAPRPATDQAGVIGSIAVTGNSRLPAQEVIDASGLKAGDPPVARVFEAARDRLLATGAIESVGWRYQPQPDGSFAATVEINEIEQMLPWQLDRLPVSREEVEKGARSQRIAFFGRQIPTTDQFIGRVAGLVQAIAASKGFKDEVLGRVNLVGKDTLAVVFQPKTPPPNIAKVVVSGLRVVPAGDVQKALNDVAVGTPYSDLHFQMLLENQAKPVFEAFGRLMAVAKNITTAPAADVNGVVVNVEFDEGPAFKLAGVTVKGTTLTKSEVDALGEWRIGEVVSYSDVGKGMNKILTEMRKLGYLQVKYKAERRLEPGSNEVWLTVEVEPGTQFRFGRLTLVGLDIESEPVIRKLYAVKPGDPFDAEYPERFLKMIRERGILDFLGETKAEVKLDESSHRADVTLTFKAEPLPQKKKRGLP